MAILSSIEKIIPRPADRSNIILRLAILGSAILGSILLAMRATRKGWPDSVLSDPLILLLPLAFACLLLLRWPPLGLVALVAAALINPIQFRTGTVTRVNSAMLLLALLIVLWLYGEVVEKRRISLVSARTIIPLVAFIAVAAFSFIVGQLPWFVFAQKAPLSAQLGGLSVFVLAAAAFLLVGVQVREVRWLEWMTWLFLVLSAIYLAGQIVPGLAAFTRVVQRAVYANSSFWIWLVAITFSQAMFNDRLHPAWRLAIAGLFLAALYVSLGPNSHWTSGWLPPLMAVAAMLWASRSPWAWLTLVAGAGMAVLQTDRIHRLLFLGDNEYSLMTRLEAWRIMNEIVQVSPLLGLGPANYYWYTPLFSILGYSVQFNSHNNYIDIIAQTGLLGLACFLWFAWEIGRLGWWLRNRVPGGFARAFVYGALGGLVGMLGAMMLGDWVLPFIYNIGLNGLPASLLGWMFLGGLLAIKHIYSTEASSAS